jgi:hypothetical protein
MSRIKFILPILCCAAINGSWCAPASGQAPKPDPKVQALMDQVIAAYKALPAYHIKVTFKYLPDDPVFFGSGQPLSMELKLQKPNKLHLTYSERIYEGKPEERLTGKIDPAKVKTVRHQIVSDGTSVYRFQGSTNTFTKSRAGSGFPDVPATLSLPELEVLLRASDPFKKTLVPANLLTLGKPVKVGDDDLDVIEGRIAEPGVAFVGRLRILLNQKDHTFRGVQFEGEGKDPRDGKPLTFKLEAAYDRVATSPAFAAADFTFTPPPGAREEQPTVKGQSD